MGVEERGLLVVSPGLRRPDGRGGRPGQRGRGEQGHRWHSLSLTAKEEWVGEEEEAEEEGGRTAQSTIRHYRTYY